MLHRRKGIQVQLNLTTDYALRCLLYLAENPGSRSSADISKAIGVGREYTHKILRRLRDARLVSSKFGKEGGYMLSAKPEHITMFDVMSLMEDSMYISRSLEKERIGSLNLLQTPITAFYRRAQETIESCFRSVTLSDLLNSVEQSAAQP